MEKEKRKNPPSPKKIQITAMIITWLILAQGVLGLVALGIILSGCVTNLIQALSVIILFSSPFSSVFLSWKMSRYLSLKYQYLVTILGTFVITLLFMGLNLLIAYPLYILGYYVNGGQFCV